MSIAKINVSHTGERVSEQSKEQGLKSLCDDTFFSLAPAFCYILSDSPKLLLLLCLWKENMNISLYCKLKNYVLE